MLIFVQSIIDLELLIFFIELFVIHLNCRYLICGCVRVDP